MSRVEKEPRRKDRSRSKSPFRSFRWKKGSSKSSSGAVSDDETATMTGIFCSLFVGKSVAERGRFVS